MEPDISTDPDAATAEVAQAVADEELFEAYLAARLQQALEALNRARENLATHPNDFDRAVAVMRGVQELRDARDELAVQRHRVAAARAAAGLQAPPQETTASAAEATPGASFRAAQAERAARIMAALATQPRTCSSCQALLAADAVQCHCGYAVHAESAAPRLTDRV